MCINNRWNHLAGHNILAASIDLSLSLSLAPFHTHLSHGHTCITRKESIEGLKIGLSIFSFAWFIRFMDCGYRTFFFSSFLCINHYLMLIFVCYCCSMFISCCSLYALFFFCLIWCIVTTLALERLIYNDCAKLESNQCIWSRKLNDDYIILILFLHRYFHT